MFILWVRDMSVSETDWQWLRAVRYYATRQHDKVPPAGKYNAGQKVFFWVQSPLGVALLLTGLPLWLPEPFGSGLLATMRFLHYVAALGGGLVPHRSRLLGHGRVPRHCAGHDRG